MSCRLAVTAGSWPGPPVSQPPGWPTTATSPSKAPCGTANWLIRRTTSDQSSLWETARERQPRFLVFFRPHQVSTRLWTRSWGQQASGAADPSHEVSITDACLRDSRQGPSSRLSLGSMNWKAPLRDSRVCSVFLGTPSARGDGTHDSLRPALGREHEHLHSRLQHKDEPVNPWKQTSILKCF